MHTYAVCMRKRPIPHLRNREASRCSHARTANSLLAQLRRIQILVCANSQFPTCASEKHPDVLMLEPPIPHLRKREESRCSHARTANSPLAQASRIQMLVCANSQFPTCASEKNPDVLMLEPPIPHLRKREESRCSHARTANSPPAHACRIQVHTRTFRDVL
jgi:hypothetical protein